MARVIERRPRVSEQTTAVIRMLRLSIKFLLCCVLVIAGLLILFVLFPPGAVKPGQATQISGLQFWLVYTAIFLSLVPLVRLAKSRIPGRYTWIGVHSGVLTIGFISMPQLPQWCGLIT